MTAMEINVSSAKSLSIHDMSEILRLRGKVFNSSEQRGTDNDPDRLDLHPDTVHYWASESGQVVSCLRVLAGDEGSWWISAVCTDRQMRGKGLSGQLLQRAITDHARYRLLLYGRTYLADWYRRFGFEVVGDEIDQAGLPHYEMERKP